MWWGYTRFSELHGYQLPGQASSPPIVEFGSGLLFLYRQNLDLSNIRV
jgi:hypothetical protein